MLTCLWLHASGIPLKTRLSSNFLSHLLCVKMPLEIFPSFYSHFSDANSIVQTQEATHRIFNHMAHVENVYLLKLSFKRYLKLEWGASCETVVSFFHQHIACCIHLGARDQVPSKHLPALLARGCFLVQSYFRLPFFSKLLFLSLWFRISWHCQPCFLPYVAMREI